jgi:type IV fimbrial biogenesis protein FimT
MAMVIFGFLLMAALPAMQEWFANARIRGASESIQNGIQTARAEAIRRNRPVTFWLVNNDDLHTFLASCSLSSTGNAWVVAVNDPGGSCDEAPSLTTTPMIVTGRTAGDAGAKVTVTALQTDASTSASSITFNGFGVVTNTSAIARIDIESDGSESGARALRIAISPSGTSRMCDPSVTTDGDPRKC